MWDISHYNDRERTKLKFELEFYEHEDGTVPFNEFMEDLNPKLQAKVLRDLDILEKYGNTLREPYSKSLEDNIFELRTIFGNDITRTLYFFYVGEKIIITHGFIKKQDKTPQREINKARAYREDWTRRHNK